MEVDALIGQVRCSERIKTLLCQTEGSIFEAANGHSQHCRIMSFALAKIISSVLGIPVGNTSLLVPHIEIWRSWCEEPVKHVKEPHVFLVFWQSNYFLFIDPTRGQFDDNYRKKILILEGEVNTREEIWDYLQEFDLSSIDTSLLSHASENQQEVEDLFQRYYSRGTGPEARVERISDKIAIATIITLDIQP